jgi:gliding motility-associated-like protein
MVSTEGCASISDAKTGQLLCYTNGKDIWDATNNVMPNGSGLLAGSNTSASQGVLILPYPEKKGFFIVFTVDETGTQSSNGFRFSVVDMSLNNSLGDVVTNQKNILIQTNTTERLCAIAKADGTGYWICIHERDNNRFKAYAVSKTGVSLNPTISDLGSVHSSVAGITGDGTMGCMKFSHDSKKLAVALYSLNKVELFDFDACTGRLSNPKTINTADNPYGLEFSPDNTKLYISIYDNIGFRGIVYQTNLQSPTLSTVAVGSSSSSNTQCLGDMSLAPNGKIYITVNSESWLSAINSPNTLGAACGFIDTALRLPFVGLFPTTGVLGLPPNVPNTVEDSLNYSATILTQNNCLGDSTFFTLKSNQVLTNIRWDFGVDSIDSDTSIIEKPLYIYPTADTFTIVTTFKGGCTLDTVSKRIVIKDCNIIDTSCVVFVPNIFTPNTDSFNDRFQCVSVCKPIDFQLQIYNRWGQCVYSSTTLTDSWNGQMNGVDCSEGVYVYTISYTFTDQIKKVQHGTIALLR